MKEERFERWLRDLVMVAKAHEDYMVDTSVKNIVEEFRKVRKALEGAIVALESYESDLRNSDGICGIEGSLAERGFCQGRFYRENKAEKFRKILEEE